MAPATERASDRAAVLIAMRGDIDRAARHAAAGHVLVAGSHHVARLLAEAGLDAVPGSDLLAPSDKRAALDDAAAVAAAVAAWDPGDRPPALAAILRADWVRAAFAHARRIRAEAALGLPLLRERDGALVPADGPPGPRLRYRTRTPGPEAPPLPPGAPNATLVFDLRSTSGRKAGAAPETARVRPRATRNPVWVNRAENALLRLRGRDGRGLAFDVRPVEARPAEARPSGPGPDVDPLLRPLLDAVAAADAAVFHDHRSAMRALIGRTGRPAGALLNHVGHAALAGMLAALSEAGVPAEMASHGCVVPTGHPARDAVSAVLGPCGYDGFPGLDRIVPRSPLQARLGGGARVVRPPAPPPRGGPASPFRILHAPNFLAWSDGFPGYVIDCFDTVRAVRALAEAVGRVPALALDLRIKTGAGDAAAAGAFRGVMPGDVADVIDPARGVHDASTGSHAAAMDAAGLVVSEGLTAVFFEALERRRPVLLLNVPGTTHALPGAPLRAALADGARAAVYTATMEDDLAALLPVLAARHAGAPLTDDELRGLVWPDA